MVMFVCVDLKKTLYNYVGLWVGVSVCLYATSSPNEKLYRPEIWYTHFHRPYLKTVFCIVCSKKWPCGLHNFLNIFPLNFADGSIKEVLWSTLNVNEICEIQGFLFTSEVLLILKVSFWQKHQFWHIRKCMGLAYCFSEREVLKLIL